jgi:exoribonuclease-2
VIINTPDLKIKVKDGKVSIHLVPMNLPGHLVVSELMILFNCSLAEKFMKEKVPALFRIQAQKPEPISFSTDDPLYPLKLRWALGGASLSITPAPHYSVGSQAYTQATSPIRRYSDLIMHRQLIAVLNGQPLPYSESVLQDLKMNLERAEKAVKMVELARNLFWIYKYLQANKGKTYNAIVSRVIESQKVLVFIPELLQEFPCYVEHLADAEEGKMLTLRAMDAYPRQKRVFWTQV